MEQFMRILDKIEAVISTVLLGLLVLLVFSSALLRYLGYPLNWTDAIAGALFVWVIYMAADRALRDDRHMGVDLAVKWLPAKPQTVLAILAHLIVLVFLVVVIYVGISLTLANTGRIIQDIPVSYSWVSLSVPVGAALMSLTLMAKILAKVKEFLKG